MRESGIQEITTYVRLEEFTDHLSRKIFFSTNEKGKKKVSCSQLLVKCNMHPRHMLEICSVHIKQMQGFGSEEVGLDTNY